MGEGGQGVGGWAGSFNKKRQVENTKNLNADLRGGVNK